MNESQLYEILGRKQAQLDQLSLDYNKAVAVLKSIKEGTLNLDRLTVNADGTWSLVAEVK